MRLRAALLSSLTLAAGVLIAGGGGAAAQDGGTPPYMQPELPTEQRVADLLGRMTLEEKAGQMGQINATVLQGDPGNPWDRGELNPEMLDLVLNQNQIGSILSGGGASPATNTPRAWAEMTNAIQRFALDHSRLGIPIVYGIDAVHGHNNVLGATMFPHQIGLGAASDPKLVRKLGARTARAVRATGAHWNFAPVLDTARDLRWGRYYEPYSEDPLINGTLGAKAIRGMQGSDLSASTAVAATAKHFIGYSAPDNGHDRTDATISNEQLMDLHAPPFASGIRAGAATAMLNSASVNTVPVHGSHELATGLLKERLGFGGVVVSDWQDVENLLTKYHVVDTYEDAVALAVNSGMDMSMVPLDAPGHVQALLGAVQSGKVSMARVDEAVSKILALKFELGLFERPFVDAGRADAIVRDRRDLPLARRAAAESLLLLENDGALPVSHRARRVLVTGPSSDSPANQLGGWTIGWQGVIEGEVPEVTTVREGMRRFAPRGTDVRWTPGLPSGDAAEDPAAIDAAIDEAVAAARRADSAVVVVGEPPYAETPGDTDTAALPPAQAELIDRLAATRTPTTVVVIAGRPLVMNDQLRRADAAMMAFLPGTEGGSAIARAVFGYESPSGRLSVSWPRSIDQAPIYYNRSATQSYDPRYPFGYGLSYTRFDLDDLHAPSVVRAGDRVRLSFELGNKGRSDAAYIAQAFVERGPGPATAARRQLVAFKRVRTREGDRREVRLKFPVDRLAVTDPDSGERVLAPGTYRLRVGSLMRQFQVRVP